MQRKNKKMPLRPIGPSWREVMPLLLELYVMGKPNGRKQARAALDELALFLDALNEQHPEISVIYNGDTHFFN